MHTNAIPCLCRRLHHIARHPGPKCLRLHVLTDEPVSSSLGPKRGEVDRERYNQAICVTTTFKLIDFLPLSQNTPNLLSVENQ